MIIRPGINDMLAILCTFKTVGVSFWGIQTSDRSFGYTAANNNSLVFLALVEDPPLDLERL